MKLYPIVEGQGEIEAVPVLLRRLIADVAACYLLQVGRPIRQTSTRFRREPDVKNMVRLAALNPDCAAILLLFDADDDCPVECAERVRQWAKDAAGSLPCEVVIACREYESWFLASIESLRGYKGISAQAEAPAVVESKRNAKGALEAFMPAGSSYSPTIDQTPMSQRFEMSMAYRRSRSFRKMVKAVGDLLRQLDQPLPCWPPVDWWPER